MTLTAIAGNTSSAVAGNWTPGDQRITAIAPTFRISTVKNGVTHAVACFASLSGMTRAADPTWLSTLTLEPRTCQRLLPGGNVPAATRVVRNPLEAVSIDANNARLVLSGTTEIEIEIIANCTINILPQGTTASYHLGTNGTKNPSLWFLTNQTISIKQPPSLCGADGNETTTGNLNALFAMTNRQDMIIKTV